MTGHVIISGASGFLGTALRESLEGDGVRVTRLVRREARDPSEVSWRPDAPLDPSVLEGADAVVNLSGASIARVPWTRRYRDELVRSRLGPTGALATAVAALGDDAPHLVSASAVGFYGDRPGESLTEASPAGATFLARLCADWEAAALAAGPGARVALLRTAPVLHARAVLKPLIPLTRLGLSGPLGNGRQFWPWISLEDEIRAIRHIIARHLTGPVNLTGPTPATASDIGRELARQLHRPFLIPAPRFALRAVLGRDAADGLLLPDALVSPDRLLETGFEFRHPTIEAAIASGLPPQNRTTAS